MIVCVCRRVSDRDIRREAHNGCANFDELQMELGVGTCCGCCDRTARDVFAQACDATAANEAKQPQPILAAA